MDNQLPINFVLGGNISAFAVLGCLIVIFIGNLLAKTQVERQRVQQAIDRFKDSFTEIIHYLRITPEGVVFNLGGIIEEGHERAKTQLEICLSIKSKRRLNKIWNKYKNDTKDYYAKLSGHDFDSSVYWRNKFCSEIEAMIREIDRVN